MDQKLKFGLVLGWLVVLKISDWAVKYATFDDNFSIYSWAKNYLAFKKEYCIVSTQKAT